MIIHLNLDNVMESQGIKINLNRLYPFVYSVGLKLSEFAQSYESLNGYDGLGFIRNELIKSESNPFNITSDLEREEITHQLFHFYYNPNDLNNPLGYVINHLSKLN